jgi:S-adenosylmethionine:tRNA ribosyltransferase-isomerase
VIAAGTPEQRPADARLLVVDDRGAIAHVPRHRFTEFLRRGDLLVANDAVTLPSSLQGTHLRSGAVIEVRLAGARSLELGENPSLAAVVFGAGDFRTRTEDRAAPPALAPGDRLSLGSLEAAVERLLGHPRLVELRFHGSRAKVWAAFAREGHPIQYAHLSTPLALWDVWTPIAGAPLAFEAPSAGFALDWQSLGALRARGARFATITLAAGLSSTGDPDLDRRLPLDEPYRIPESTVRAVRTTRARGGRVVAVGTTVVRALESAAATGALRAGDRLATLRIGAHTPLRIVDAVFSGTHEPGTSHYELLRAFAGDATLARMAEELDARGYRTHEFGDSVLVERPRSAARRSAGAL